MSEHSNPALESVAQKVAELGLTLLEPASFSVKAEGQSILADAQAEVRKRKRQAAVDRVTDLLLKLDGIKTTAKRKLREVQTACQKDLKEADKLEKQLNGFLQTAEMVLGNQPEEPQEAESE